MEKVWCKTYQEGVPEEINPDIYSSIVDFLEEAVAKYFNRPAFRNFSHTITYADLDRYSQEYAGYLQNHLGLKKGDRLAIMLPNVLQYPVAMFGALRAGLVIVNVNPLYTPREVIHQMNDAGVETIIVLANFAHTIQEALPKTKLKNIIITEIADLLPPLKRCLINFAVKYIKRMVPAYTIPHAIRFRDTLKLGAKSPYHRVKLQGSDVAFLQYTGGTTGVSKGAVLTHRNMVANTEQVTAWVKPVLPEDQVQTIVTPLPLYHIFSLMANCLLFMRLGGLNLLITNPRDLKDFIRILKKEKFTAITGVNTLFNALLHHPDFAKLDFSSLFLSLGGGMAVQGAVAQAWQKMTKKPLIEGYGLTEASPVVCVAPMNLPAYNGSIGLPVPSTEIKIINEKGEEVAKGEVGELCVRGPQVMQGYWQRPAETAEVLTADGWLLTGDIAKIDEQGFIYIVDRKKDLILVSGFNVYPNEVEEVIMAHPGVREVAVVGVCSDKSGEAVKAFVVKKDPLLTEAALRDFCSQSLTAYKRPKFIEFRDDLPKSNVGKILRRVLRDEEKAKQS